MIATFSPPGTSSPGRKSRPSSGWTPSIENAFAVIQEPSNRSAFSSPLT